MVKEDVRSWAEDIPNSDIEVEIETRLAQPNFVRSMPPVEGAVESMRKLASDGHYLVVATARDEATAREATESLLDEQGIPFDEMRHVENGGKQVLDADVPVDDYPGNVTSFVESGGVGILFEQPWNRDFEPPRRESGECYVARGWKDVYAIVDDLSGRVDEPRSETP